jgi:tRNA modification GTPase
MKNRNEETIVAQASPFGTSAIAVIRVSGKLSNSILKKIINKKKFIPNKACYGKIIRNNSLIDDVQFIFYKSPKSYTGEDCFEIYCHGNQILVKKIIGLIVEEGGVPAKNGEFTKRAFLNGKIDLIQAESISDIINAQSEIELEFFRKNKDGILTKKVGYLRQILVEILKKVELEIDFNDQDVEIYDENLIKRELKKVEKEVKTLIENHSLYKKIKKGVEICFYGDTNVGKSSLYNLLLNEERSIVDKEDGTTRNLISSNLHFKGDNLTIYDTAGVRDTSSTVENKGVLQTIKKVKEADIVLYVVDASRKETQFLHKGNSLLEKNKTIRIVNKIDIIDNVKLDDDECFFQTIYTSAKKNRVGNLKNIINKLLLSKKDIKESFFINERQFYTLKEAKKYIDAAKKVIATPDLLSYELKMIAECLENFIGTIKSETILNEIFDNFCIGK